MLMTLSMVALVMVVSRLKVWFCDMIAIPKIKIIIIKKIQRDRSYKSATEHPTHEGDRTYL